MCEVMKGNDRGVTRLWCPIRKDLWDSFKMKQDTALIWTSLGFTAAVVMPLQPPHSLHAQLLTPPSAADTRATAQPAEAARAKGTLEGMVTLACPHGAIDCTDRPYPVGLFIQREQNNSAPIHVDASPRFSITLEAGGYTITSADVRGSCCLPILGPITVVISPGKVTHVEVRFAPGPELPKR